VKLLITSLSVKWTAAIIIGGMVIVVLVGYIACSGKPDIPPQKAIDQALANTAGQHSYEYEIRMKTVIDGKDELVSEVKGSRQEQNRIHIIGRIFESEVDFYQIGSTTYTKDQLTGEWIKITDTQLNQQDIFMQELNPLAGFSYKELNEAVFAGAETIDGKRLWVYTAKPVIDNEYMALLWQGFQYKFWVEPRGFLVYNAQINAVGKNNVTNKLNLEVKFRKYNGDIEVKEPDAGNPQ